MKKLYLGYIASFQGLSREVWWLALITLINRAGTMVIPFLSLYLTQQMSFSLEEVGSIMMCFGLGSLVGAWVGGKLSDWLGYYRVMYGSLFLTGLLFIGLQFVNDFWSICLGIFFLMIAADAFRPASYVALSAYSKPANKTRSVTLIRLAINLGFSAGPALGGILISTIGYQGLFWADGSTCIIASILLLLVLNPKKAKVYDTVVAEAPQSAYKDSNYLIFIVCMILFSFAFVQYFSTVPLFYKEEFNLNEFQIGLILAMNGFTIFALEMPLIKYLESKLYSQLHYVLFGLVLVALSFIVLIVFEFTGILVIGMLLMTLGEMIAFPFSNAFAMNRAKKGNRGEYMALYSIAFSVSHIFAHSGGMTAIAHIGFTNTWWIISGICLFGIVLLYYLIKKNIQYPPIRE